MQKNDYKTIWGVTRAFLKSRDADGRTAGTIDYYESKFNQLMRFCETQGVEYFADITKDMLRDFLLWLRSGHKPGGVRASYRAIKALFNWYELEFESDIHSQWRNPIRRVKMPRADDEVLDPADPYAIERMLKACAVTRSPLRNRAILLVLADTGVRASELLEMDIDDVDMPARQIFISRSKNHKPRYVTFDVRAKAALKAWLVWRDEISDGCEALWTGYEGERMRYAGLRQLLHRLAALAGVEYQTAHSFRRRFCLDMYDAGATDHATATAAGHSDTQMVRRYQKLDRERLRRAADQSFRHKRKRR